MLRRVIHLYVLYYSHYQPILNFQYYYYDKDITLLATYDFKKQRVIYIHKNDYRYLKPKDLKKVNEYNFPINENMSSYRKTNSTSPKPIDVYEVSK